MANRKPPRTDNDIQALAARWRTEWTPNDGIEPWLRRHLTDLTTLIRNDRWSWNDLARALNEARILYATGRSWSAARLSGKVRTLRARQRLTATQSTPQELAATVREALAATAGSFANITINLPGAVAVPPEPAIRPPSRRAIAASANIEAAVSSQHDVGDIQEEPGFAFAKLKDWSPPASEPAAADQPSSATKGSNQDVERVLQEFLSRPRRGSIPMPPVPEPEDE